MKLIQVVHNTAGKIYIYECPVCGFSVMVHETDSGFVCPNCSGFPRVEVYNGYWKSYMTIDIGKQYVYKDFDIEATDGGKDLVLHFVEGD